MRIVLTHPFCWPHVRRGTERNVAEMGRYLARREFMQQQATKASGLQMVPVNPELGENIVEYAKLMREIFGQ